MIDRRAMLVMVACAGFTGEKAAAQTRPERVYRVGMICRGTPNLEPSRNVFIAELAHQGFVEGRNLVIESRGERDSAPDDLLRAATALIASKVDVITTWCGTAGAQAARLATREIPIVFNASADPVALGLVASLARPGGNLTGSSTREYEVAPKGLEFLKSAVPTLKKVAVLYALPTAELPWFQRYQAALRVAGTSLGIELQFVGIADAVSIESSVSSLVKNGFGAVLVLGGIADPAGFKDAAFASATKNRLPSFSTDGDRGLLQIKVSRASLSRRTARYTARILRGARPAELPVEQDEEFELTVNLRTAKALGLKLPQSLMLRADRVID